MRITFIATKVNLSTGGGSHHSFHLTVSELARLGHDVRVIVLDAPQAPQLGTLPYRIESVGLDKRTRLAGTRATADLLRRYADATDVYHLYEPHLALGGGLYKVGSGAVPVVVTLNHYQLFCTNVSIMDGQCFQRCGIATRLLHSPTPLMRRISSLPARLYEEWLGFQHVRQLDHFFPDSPAVQEIYRQAGFEMRHSTVIPEVIDYHRMRARAAQVQSDPLRTKTGAWQILYAGRLVPAKGVDVLIDAVAKLDVPAHLHIAGTGWASDALRRRVQERGLADRVTFHGWVPNEMLWQLYRQVDVFVHPGRWPEPCGRTIQEAMTIGVPTIVSDIGGPPWLLGDYGRTFAPGDPIDLAAKLRACFQDYEEAVECASRAHERAAEFDYPRVIPRLVEVYRTLQRRHDAVVAVGGT